VGGIQHGGIVVEHVVKIPEAGFGEVEIEGEHGAAEDVCSLAPAGVDIPADEASYIFYLVLTGFIGSEVFGEGFGGAVGLGEAPDELRPGCLGVLPLKLFAGAACGEVEGTVVKDGDGDGVFWHGL